MAGQPTSPVLSRPTLPSLHSLNLPQPIMIEPILPAREEKMAISPYDQPTWHRTRKSSVSSTSSCTTSSDTSLSSSDCDVSQSIRATPSPPVPLLTKAFTLVRSTLEEANAFVLVPPSPEPYVQSISALSRANAAAASNNPRQEQALLLVGPTVNYLKHPKVRIAKGTHVHPYRIVHGPSRRSSVTLIATTSSANWSRVCERI